MSGKLDQTDRQILNILQQDAKLEIRTIAGMIRKSVSPTHERIQKLQRQGYIQRYVAVLDREKIGRPVLAIIQVSLTRHTQEHFGAFEQQVGHLEEVLQCLQLSGNCDFILHVALADMAAYQYFLVNRLCALPNVEHTGTCFVLKECKSHTTYPL